MAKKAKQPAQKSNLQSSEEKTKSRTAPATTPNKNNCAPIEQCHGETTSKHLTEQGDLDEETLDRDAPYNKTYGRADK